MAGQGDHASRSGRSAMPARADRNPRARPVCHRPTSIGTPGTPWGPAERLAWRASQSRQRSYTDEVVARILDQVRTLAAVSTVLSEAPLSCAGLTDHQRIGAGLITAVVT